MNALHRRIASFLVLAGSALALPSVAEELDRVPAPLDWSHRHLIFSKPATPAEAIRDGTFEQWQKDYRDPRFVLALQRRLEREADQGAQAATAPVATTFVTKATRVTAPVMEGPSPRPALRGSTEYPVSPRVAPPHRDWNIPMGGASGVGSAGTFPAKYNFDISATPSCANDFVVYPTSSAGVTGSGTQANRSGTVSGSLNNGATLTITNGTRSIVLTATGAANTGLNFANITSNNVRAANLAAAINRNGNLVGVTASAAAAVVTITAQTHGTGGNSIDVSHTLTNFSYTSGNNLQNGAGTAGQPTIFAVNQLYSSCNSATAGAPMTFWSYNTGAAAIVDSSPIISLNGTQVVFIQRSGTVASLVILKWSSASPGSIGNPTAPTSVAVGSYRACTAPCMTSITLNGSPNNTNSSPYYYYDTDELWVGDNAGKLHKFTNIFLSGTPTEVTTGGWPVTVDAGRTLSAPVYEKVANLIYVGSVRAPDTGGTYPNGPAGTPNGGKLYTVNNATAAVLTSGQLAGNPIAGNGEGSMGVSEAVIVDQSARRIYAFVATDMTTAALPCNNNTANVECHAVYQFNADASIAGSTGLAKATFGRGQIWSRTGYAGVFDNAYYSSANPANPSGFLYVCGSANGGATSRQPSLWRIPITSNAMGAAVAGQTLVSGDTSDASGGGGTCSPITDVQNGANNYIYVSVPELGNRTGCTGSCIYVYNLTGITWGTTNATAGLTAPGGTSGIVIDNISSTTGASQVYYSTLTSPGGAIQASQASLN